MQYAFISIVISYHHLSLKTSLSSLFFVALKLVISSLFLLLLSMACHSVYFLNKRRKRLNARTNKWINIIHHLSLRHFTWGKNYYFFLEKVHILELSAGCDFVFSSLENGAWDWIWWHFIFINFTAKQKTAHKSILILIQKSNKNHHVIMAHDYDFGVRIHAECIVGWWQIICFSSLFITFCFTWGHSELFSLFQLHFPASSIQLYLPDILLFSSTFLQKAFIFFFCIFLDTISFHFEGWIGFSFYFYFYFIFSCSRFHSGRSHSIYFRLIFDFLHNRLKF